MTPKNTHLSDDVQSLAEQAAARGDWQAAAEHYARLAERRAAELALINSVQEGLSSKLDMQSIYDLVGDSLRDTFNAQVVMISQYDPASKRVSHHYAIERGQHLTIPDWQPVDSSRAEIVRTRKPFIINLDKILEVVKAGKMRVVPGTELPKTWLGVPMLVGNSVVGMVSLQNLDIENAFSQSDIDLLTTLTNSLSLSLENARLFNEKERLLKMLEEEMKIARRTQRSILPARMPHHAGYEFGSLITPARAVGGDFYDLIPIDDHRTCLVIGDVSDKGLPAALFMALTFSLLRAETEHSDDPRQILLNVNRYLRKMNASNMFVTLLYAVLDFKTGRMKYARAGHLPPIVLGSHGHVVPIERDLGQPLGLFADVSLDVQQVTIPHGGLAAMFSDGLTEATDALGQEFGVDRVRQELFLHRDEGAKTICRQLWAAVRAHSGDRPNQDDFAAVVVKRPIE